MFGTRLLRRLTGSPKARRLPRGAGFHSELLTSRKSVDLEVLAARSLSIPGMIAPGSGQFLYSLCVAQTIIGDVVEIGSWQGRSTTFIAAATRDSLNGTFYAIDHFKGNVGKEDRYRVGKEDLSDLKAGFIRNVSDMGLLEHVMLLDMPNDLAARKLADCKVRFLFIDGDHTESGVRRDIALFFPRLVPGAVIVFDDFVMRFPGVIAAVNDLAGRDPIARCFTYDQTAVLILK